MFVCDNLAFHAEHIIKRKHTVKAKRELPALVSEIVAALRDRRIAQNQKLLTYKAMNLRDEAADHAILTMYRKDIIGVQAIGHVLKAYDEPPHDWGPRTAWRLFNAATYALVGKVAERPALTQELHRVIDATCETVH